MEGWCCLITLLNQSSKRHVVNLSGGKDSVAMLLSMLKRDMQVDAIHFADVGEMAEFTEMYPYLDKIEKHIGRPITRLKSTLHTARSIFYGYPSRGKHTDEIRGFPLTIGSGCRYRSWLKSDVLDAAAGPGSTIYIGFAADEPTRIRSNEYGKNKDIQYRFPLNEWGFTEADCLQYTKDEGMYNELYDYFPRLGCFWCPKQSVRALRSLYYYFPEYWRILQDMQEAQGAHRPFQYMRSVEQLEVKFEKERLKYYDASLCRTGCP